MKHSIMVVDDSRLIYAEMKKMLTETDFEIIQFCRSGEEAIEQYPIIQPDLVTMDIVMPGIDGIEAAVAIIKQWPEARILMVSSLAYDDTMQAATEIGAQGFLFKPFDRQSLLDAVQKSLGTVD